MLQLDSRMYRRSKRKRKKQVRNLVILCIVALIATYFLWPTNAKISNSKSTGSNTKNTTTTTVAADIQATNMPISLAVDVSREAVVYDQSLSPDTIILAGGLFSSGTTTVNVASVNLVTGAEVLLGSLSQPVHDTTAQILGNSLYVLGGGASTVIGSVQAATFNGLGQYSMTFAVASTLPQPRADLTSVVHDGQIYVLDGYDGSSMDGEILSTYNGTTFTDAGSLAVPIRYGAVVATANAIYIFGGINQSGQYVTSIQKYSFIKRTTSIVGNLPVGLAGASAGLLNNNIYIAGGQDTTGTLASIFEFNRIDDKIGNAGTLPVPEAYSGYIVANSVSATGTPATGTSTVNTSPVGTSKNGSSATSTGALGASALYIVGGENNGKLTNNIQELIPNSKIGYVS